jgi:hypothetical protein
MAVSARSVAKLNLCRSGLVPGRNLFLPGAGGAVEPVDELTGQVLVAGSRFRQDRPGSSASGSASAAS